jgi:hypothetical protein
MKNNRSSGEFSLNSKDLQTRFESTLKSFGFETAWIKKKTIKDGKSDRTYPLYKITLPNDLSIPEVLLEIYSEFRKDSLVIESEEKSAGGKSILTLKENNLARLSAEFNYDKNLKRERGSLAFIIKNIELGNINDSLLVEAADKFNVLFTPSEENLSYLPFIVENRKSYSVIIGDEINEANYKLDASYSLLRISNVIKALSVDYVKASFFIIDENFDFYNSDKFKYFNRELEKRGIKLYKLSDFILFENKDSISENFNRLVKDLRKGELKILVLSKNDYIQLKPEISLYKKAGVQIINISEIE